MKRDDFPAPREGFVLTHFLSSNDVERSRAFYSGLLGGEVILEKSPCIVKLANGWIIINDGGGPTEDKPEVTLAPRAIPLGSAAFSISGWPTSRPGTRSGGSRAPSS